MKSFLRRSRASGSEKRKVELIARQGERRTRRQFVAVQRKQFREGGTIYAC
jgi:hypothetical protein